MEKMPRFAPLMAPVDWWRAFVSARIDGADRDAAAAAANAGAGVRRRDWLRFSVGDARLSLPVAGGASALKNHPPDSWRLAAEAPREARKADATIATLYGRTPYYHLIADRVALSPHATPGSPASEICTALFSAVENIICTDSDSLLDSLRQRIDAGDPRLRAVSAETSARAPGALSIIDLLMHLGPDAIFALIPPF